MIIFFPRQIFAGQEPYLPVRFWLLMKKWLQWKLLAWKQFSSVSANNHIPIANANLSFYFELFFYEYWTIEFFILNLILSNIVFRYFNFKYTILHLQKHPHMQRNNGSNICLLTPLVKHIFCSILFNTFVQSCILCLKIRHRIRFRTKNTSLSWSTACT